MLEGKAVPVSFRSDIALFDTSLSHSPTLAYSDLFGLNFALIGLQKDYKTKIPISYPTFFIRNVPYLVYPGELIDVKLDNLEDYVMTIQGNAQRNKELSFMKKFISNEMNFQAQSPTLNSSNDTIELSLLDLQNQNRAQLLRFDSTAEQQKLSPNFRKISRLYFEAEPLDKLIGFYTFSQSTFNKKEVYATKMKALLPFVNRLENIDQITYGYANSLSSIADALLPKAISDITSQTDFVNCYNNSVIYFNGIARDFVLAKIIYVAYKNRVLVPDEYLKKFDSICHTTQYALIIKNLINQQHKIDKKVKSNNSLLGIKNKTILSLETLLAQYKGKLILLDFWASWCQPCIAEMPALKKLYDTYTNKGLQILSISFDKDIQKWKKYIISNGLIRATNFVFINAKESKFVIENKIEAIPRYMLIDRMGKIITTDSPRPGDSALTELIEKNL